MKSNHGLTRINTDKKESDRLLPVRAHLKGTTEDALTPTLSHRMGEGGALDSSSP